MDAAARALRAQRGGARAHTGRARTARSSRSRGRRVEHLTNLATFFGADADPSELGERIRIMLDSTKLLYDPATMRNYTMSEYILRS